MRTVNIENPSAMRGLCVNRSSGGGRDPANAPNDCGPRRKRVDAAVVQLVAPNAPREVVFTIRDVVVAVVVVAAILARQPGRFALQVRRLVAVLIPPVAAEFLVLLDGLDVFPANDDGLADLHRVRVVVAPAIESVELRVGDGAFVAHVIVAVVMNDDERAVEPLVGVLAQKYRT